MMKLSRAYILLCLAIYVLAAPQNLCAQSSTVTRIAREITESILTKGTAQGAKELAEVGGEQAIKEVLEASLREGGDALATKVARYTKTYGSTILLGAKKSPARFIRAFEELPVDLKSSAPQALRRDPELVAGLTTQFGRDALVAVAKQPGIAAPFIKTFGLEGAKTLGKLTTDQSIQLVKMSRPLGKIPPAAQKDLFEMIGQAPDKVLDLLERHPNVLLSVTGLVAFLAAKDQILGKDEIVITPDGEVKVVRKLGFIGSFVKEHQTQISTILYILGAGIAGWFAIKLWGTWRRERSQVP